MKIEAWGMGRLQIFLSVTLTKSFLIIFIYSVGSTAIFAKHSATIGHRSLTLGRKFPSFAIKSVTYNDQLATFNHHFVPSWRVGYQF